MSPVSAESTLLSKGALINPAEQSILFSVYSKNASRIDLYLFDAPFGKEEIDSYSMQKNGDTWSVELPLWSLQEKGIFSAIYYGYRAWGPNWVFHQSWQKGSLAGFICDVDSEGNRFNCYLTPGQKSSAMTHNRGLIQSIPMNTAITIIPVKIIVTWTPVRLLQRVYWF